MGDAAADGGAVATIPVTNRDGFRSFVLGFLDHAEVLGHRPTCASEIVAWLEALVRMSRTTAADRATRILSIVPWVAERDGPDDRGDLRSVRRSSRAELVADLDVVFMVGTPPYTPDTSIDVAIEDDRVWIRLGDYFRRPMRLVPGEALSLLTAGRAWMQTSGVDEDGALGRALDKLQPASVCPPRNR